MWPIEIQNKHIINITNIIKQSREQGITGPI